MTKRLLLAAALLLGACDDGSQGATAYTCSESVGCQSGYACEPETSRCVPDTRADLGAPTDAGRPLDGGGAEHDLGGIPGDAATDMAPATDLGSPPDAAPADGDGDGLADSLDNCPEVANEDQTDGDGDGLGDACDARPDNADFRNSRFVDGTKSHGGRFSSTLNLTTSTI